MRRRRCEIKRRNRWERNEEMGNKEKEEEERREQSSGHEV